MAWRWQKLHDLVCVVSTRNRGWVLDRLAHELAACHPGSAVVTYREGKPPNGRAYFFTHPLLWMSAVAARPDLAEGRCAVLFTHPRGADVDGAFADSLGATTVVISMSSTHVAHLVDAGVAAERIQVVIPGTDPLLFRPHPRGGGVVGLCSAYYERKGPERLLEVVRSMPARDFMLVGRGWREAGVFSTLEALPNFCYVEADYAEYPALYDRMDVFLSVSDLEGGPIPLLEAMMSNVVPVASRTGFAPDLIRHGNNGFIFEPSDRTTRVAELIDAAFACPVDVRSTVDQFTYDEFFRRVIAAMAR